MYVEETPMSWPRYTARHEEAKKKRANVAAHNTFDLTYVDYAQMERYGQERREKKFRK